MLDRDGSVLATTGPVRSADARLRRAQACADQSEAALRIVRKLISEKLVGQEQVVREKLGDSAIAQTIAKLGSAVATAETIQAIRLLESQAGAAYWSAWHALPITFPKYDLRRVPDHWCVFGKRTSPLSGSSRLATNPPNAMLNYLYALLESEACLGAAALGLDPGLGVLHVDSPARDSLACDLMEPVRPQSDAFVLNWITSTPLRRKWFFEQRDGTCRLTGSFTVQLSETLPTWRRAVAPLAEWVARTIWQAIPKSARPLAPATRLTQRRKREAHGGPSMPPAEPAPQPVNICRVCGTPITPGTTYCVLCAVSASTENLAKVRRSGQVATQSAEAQTRRSKTGRRQAAALRGWIASNQPTWLNNETYTKKIQPRLADFTRSAIVAALAVSSPYAADIRAGRRRPHPRHWLALAQVVGVSPDG